MCAMRNKLIFVFTLLLVVSVGALAADINGKWSAQVLLQHRTVLHLLLGSLALIAFILICVILFDAFVRHFVDRSTLERRRMTQSSDAARASGPRVSPLSLSLVEHRQRGDRNGDISITPVAAS